MAATVPPSVNAALCSFFCHMHSFIQACSSALCLYVLEDWNKYLMVEQLEHYTAAFMSGWLLRVSHG